MIQQPTLGYIPKKELRVETQTDIFVHDVHNIKHNSLKVAKEQYKDSSMGKWINKMLYTLKGKENLIHAIPTHELWI